MDHDPVELLIFDSGSYRVEMSQERFIAINNDARTCLGATLFETSRKDPEEAYRYLKRALGVIASQNVDAVWLNDNRIASKEQGGELETCNVASDAIESRLPNERYETFNISIGVYPSPEDAIFMGTHGTMNVCAISIKPESLVV